MILTIWVEVDEDSEWVDRDHATGLTNEGYERLYGVTGEHGAPPLGWLGEIQDVERRADDEPVVPYTPGRRKP